MLGLVKARKEAADQHNLRASFSERSRKMWKDGLMKYSVVYAIVYTPYSCMLQKYHTRFLVVYAIVYTLNLKVNCKILFATTLRRVCMQLYTQPIVTFKKTLARNGICCTNVTDPHSGN